MLLTVLLEEHLQVDLVQGVDHLDVVCPQLVISELLPLDVLLLVVGLDLVFQEHVDRLRLGQLMVVVFLIFIVIVVHARPHILVRVEIDGEPDDDLEELVPAELLMPLSGLLAQSLTLHAGLKNDIVEARIGQHVRVTDVHFFDKHFAEGVCVDPG